MSESIPKILFRENVDVDANFILNSYLKSSRSSQPLVSDEVFYREAKRHLLDLCSREDARLLVAADPVDPNVIWGWTLCEPELVHFTYVKHSLRRFGVARALLAQAGILAGFEASHLTEAARRIHADHPGLFTYNPWRAR